MRSNIQSFTSIQTDIHYFSRNIKMDSCLYHGVRSCGIINVYNYFTSPFFKRNKQKVYGHSLADSRRIPRLIHAWSRTEKAFSVLFCLEKNELQSD